MSLGERRFGTGLAWPVQRDGQGGLLMLSGEELLDSDIRLLVSIEQGELPWDMRRGTRLRRMHHRRWRGAQGDLIASNEIAKAMLRDEPRARPGQCRIEQTDQTLRVYAEYVPLGYDKNWQVAAAEIG